MLVVLRPRNDVQQNARALEKLNLAGGPPVTDIGLLGEGASLKAKALLGGDAKVVRLVL